jgi:hypothetical protein
MGKTDVKIRMVDCFFTERTWIDIKYQIKEKLFGFAFSVPTKALNQNYKLAKIIKYKTELHHLKNSKAI